MTLTVTNCIEGDGKTNGIGWSAYDIYNSYYEKRTNTLTTLFTTTGLADHIALICLEHQRTIKAKQDFAYFIPIA